MIMNIIILIFEILYYSMFMKFAKKEGKFWKYLLLFSLITIFFCFVPSANLLSYLFLVLMMLYGIKFIVRIKTSLFDMLLIIIMLLMKVAIEFIIFIPCYEFLNLSQFCSTMIFNFVKILLLVLLKNKLYLMNIKLKKLWDNNNFYIRYIFSCLTYIYVIFTLLLFIFYNFV